jgi:aspartyl protease family protein
LICIGHIGLCQSKGQGEESSAETLEAELELLADAGAIYSVVPSKALDSVKIERRNMRRMKLADGRIIERYLGIAEIEVRGETAHSSVVFGEDEDASVLGVTALEELGLRVDPVTGELEPMELLLLSACQSPRF